MTAQERLNGLLKMLLDRGIISLDQYAVLLNKLNATAENNEYLIDLLTGNYASLDKALVILFRLK